MEKTSGNTGLESHMDDARPILNPNVNTPAEIYASIRDKALEEAAVLADKRPYGFTDLSREIRALKGNADPQSSRSDVALLLCTENKAAESASLVQQLRSPDVTTRLIAAKTAADVIESASTKETR